MSRHEAPRDDEDTARMKIEALAADNDIETLGEYLRETGQHVAASTYIGLVRQNLALQHTLDKNENATRHHRLKTAGGALGCIMLGGVAAFGVANETVNGHIDDAYATHGALTEPIPEEAGIFIPGVVKRDLDQNPDHKELPVVPTAAWCEPNPEPGRAGTLHYDVLINPKLGALAGMPNPTLESEFCEPSSAITVPVSFAAQFDLSPYTMGR